MAELPRRQAEALQYIRDYLDVWRVAPSVRDIAKSLGMTPNGAQQILRGLEAKGRIQRLKGKARGLILL